MADEPAREEDRIRALLESWAGAVRRHDVAGILAHHEPDLLMFDLPPPLQCTGLAAYGQTWRHLFGYHTPGTAFDSIDQTTPLRETTVAVPIVALGGAKGLGDEVAKGLAVIASDVTGTTLAGCGHFVPEEEPEAIIRHVLALASKVT